MRDAWMTLRTSNDGAHNFGNASQHFLGEEGAFCVAVERYRMGSQRQMVIRSSVSSPTRVDVLAQAIQADRER